MEKLKILVVDDEERIRRFVKDYLIKNSFEVIEAEDGLKALDAFYDNPDIALITLPVEFDASRRAIKVLDQMGIFEADEKTAGEKVL